MWGIKSTEWDENDGFYTRKLYEELETTKTFARYDKYCRSFEAPVRNRSLVKNICSTILNYLETTYSALNHTNDAYNVCILLNYWVYERLNVFLYSNDFKYINPIFGEIVLKWNDFIKDKSKELKNEICKPNDKIVVYDDWKKRQKLYEYYVDYHQIIQQIQYDKTHCKEFRQYIESKKTLYDHFKERCPNTDTNKCPEFYVQCEEYHPEKVLPNLDCYGGIRQVSDIASSRVPRIGSGDSVHEPDSEDSDGPKMPDDAPILSGKPHNVRMYGNVLLGVVATSMTSGALYRFTPLGGMIRNGLGWNTNNMSNINGGDIRLYDYASGPFNPYPGEEHYIGYHPA
ncbi:PIR protein [Plasmodium vivax]|nr:PIR protein [Plasmodium vivax]